MLAIMCRMFSSTRIKLPVALFVLALIFTPMLTMHRIADAQSSGFTYGSGSVTGIDGTGVSCTSYWKWRVSTLLAYSEVEWTANRCGFQIQDQSVCHNFIHNSDRSTYSGIVKGTYIWDRASCDTVQETLKLAYEHDRNNASSPWRAWRNYWP